ncbi:MAG: ApbE family lipoprotein [Humibacillus sp.]|nr:ApbE family lipoprotein [Humibacillus sp.]
MTTPSPTSLPTSLPTAPMPDAAPRADSSEEPRRAWVEQVMGMPVSIHLRGLHADTDAGGRAVAAAFAELHEMDRIFSTYRDDSDLMRLRREEVGVGQVSPLVEEALRLGERAERETLGAFTTLLPTDGGELAFDPTGLVKGWAVDRAAAALTDLPGTSACLNAGGDLRIVAAPDLPLEGVGSIAWRVGVEDPRDRSQVAHTVTLARGAVATSGTAARGAHLYDPSSGEMVGRSGSVTVVGPELLWADIWATALFVGGARTAEAFTDAAPDYRATVL